MLLIIACSLVHLEVELDFYDRRLESLTSLLPSLEYNMFQQCFCHITCFNMILVLALYSSQCKIHNFCYFIKIFFSFIYWTKMYFISLRARHLSGVIYTVGKQSIFPSLQLAVLAVLLQGHRWTDCYTALMMQHWQIHV